MGGHFLGGNFLGGNFLGHADIFGKKCMGGNFLSEYRKKDIRPDASQTYIGIKYYMKRGANPCFSIPCNAKIQIKNENLNALFEDNAKVKGCMEL